MHLQGRVKSILFEQLIHKIVRNSKGTTICIFEKDAERENNKEHMM